MAFTEHLVEASEVSQFELRNPLDGSSGANAFNSQLSNMVHASDTESTTTKTDSDGNRLNIKLTNPTYLSEIVFYLGNGYNAARFKTFDINIGTKCQFITNQYSGSRLHTYSSTTDCASKPLLDYGTKVVQFQNYTLDTAISVTSIGLLKYECKATDCDNTELEIINSDIKWKKLELSFDELPYKSTAWVLYDTRSKFCGNSNKDGFTYCGLSR